MRTFKPRLHFVAGRNENKTEHTNHSDTTPKERDKQDYREVIAVDRVRVSACVFGNSSF